MTAPSAIDAVARTSTPTRRTFNRLAALGLSTLGSSLAAGCSPARLLNAFVPDGGYRLIENQAYGAGTRRKLDVYVAEAAAGLTPAVVFIYGGNWRSGDKGIYRFVGQALASRGFTVAIPDYRLYPEVRFPGFLEDNAAAFSWVRAHAGEIGIDPGHLYLMGHSAGAYNAAMLTLDRRWLGEVGLDPRRDVSGFVGLAGPYDFLPLDDDTGPVFGSAPDARETQPVNFVDGREPPMLLATGLDDTTVRPRNTMRLAAVAGERGGRVEVKTYPGVGHVRLVADLAAPLQSSQVPVVDDTIRFLQSTR